MGACSSWLKGESVVTTRNRFETIFNVAAGGQRCASVTALAEAIVKDSEALAKLGLTAEGDPASLVKARLLSCRQAKQGDSSSSSGERKADAEKDSPVVTRADFINWALHQVLAESSGRRDEVFADLLDEVPALKEKHHGWHDLPPILRAYIVDVFLGALEGEGQDPVRRAQERASNAVLSLAQFNASVKDRAEFKAFL